jgi:hypothetical protein
VLNLLLPFAGGQPENVVSGECLVMRCAIDAVDVRRQCVDANRYLFILYVVGDFIQSCCNCRMGIWKNFALFGVLLCTNPFHFPERQHFYC